MMTSLVPDSYTAEQMRKQRLIEAGHLPRLSLLMFDSVGNPRLSGSKTASPTQPSSPLHCTPCTKPSGLVQ